MSLQDSTLEERWVRLAPWLILGATAVCYAPVLSAGFVWDDIAQVLGNRLTDSLAKLPAIFSTDVWSSAGVVVEDPPYYRPLFIGSLALDRSLWGLSPLGHHLQSLLWHLGATGAVYGLARALLRPMQAIVMASLFALHPVQSEAVAWISARGDPMAALFGVAAVLLLMERRASWLRIAAGALSLLAAMLCKELGLLFLVLLIGLEWARRQDAPPQGHEVRALPPAWARPVAVGLALLLWIVLRAHAGVGASRALDPSRVLDVLARLPEILGVYGRLLVWPHPLTTGRDLFELEASGLGTTFGLAGLVAGTTLLAWRGGRLAWVGLVFAAAAFAPTLLGLGATHNVGERYLYAPMIGIALAVAACVPERISSVGVMAAAAAAMMLVIGLRLPDWKDPLALAASEARDHPTSTTLTGHATELRADGQLRAALGRFDEALAQRPLNRFACAGMVETALELGDASRALGASIRTVEAGCPVSGHLASLHAQAFARSGHWAHARQSIAIALGHPPASDDRWRPVALALAYRRGDTEHAGWLLSQVSPESRPRILAEAEALVWPAPGLAAAH